MIDKIPLNRISDKLKAKKKLFSMIGIFIAFQNILIEMKANYFASNQTSIEYK